MYVWYFLVVVTSIMENLAGVPFSESWTMRISRAPSTIAISEDAPLVADQTDNDVINALNHGFNIRSKVQMPKSALAQQRVCFYAVVSQEGIHVTHAILRVIAKSSSVAVFAFGTALFAAAQLMSISVALLVLALVLGAGVMGRTVSVWIAAQMHRDNVPILHTVVRDRKAAIEHMNEIFKIPGLQVEIKGHIIINNRCVWRRSEWFHLAKYIGLLASPFDITKIAYVYDDGRHYMNAREIEEQRVFLRGTASSDPSPDVSSTLT